MNCSVSALPCNLLRPCRNNGTCTNTNNTVHPYTCSCLSGFKGTECQIDTRPCQSDTCWNNGRVNRESIEMIMIGSFVGTCRQTSNTTFLCNCVPGWLDDQCQTKNHYCKEVSCLNNGICRLSLFNYTCECLPGSFSGRHCEITANTLVVYRIVSKSFACIVIIAIAGVAVFVIVLDILKFFFGIDPTGPRGKQRPSMKAKKRKKRKKPVSIIRYTYVPGPLQKPTEQTVSSV